MLKVLQFFNVLVNKKMYICTRFQIHDVPQGVPQGTYPRGKKRKLVEEIKKQFFHVPPGSF